MPSSCVLSKAKVALDLPNNYTGNLKPFSVNEWEIALREVSQFNPVSEELIQAAIGHYNYYKTTRIGLVPTRI